MKRWRVFCSVLWMMFCFCTFTWPQTSTTANPDVAAAQKKQADLAARNAKAWEAFPRPGNWLQRHEGFVARAKQGNIRLLFLGDSITDGWNKQKELWDKYYASLPAANFGIGGDRTESIIWRLQHGEFDGIHPQVVVLLIGTNNTSKGDKPKDIVKGINTILNIIRKKSPQTKVLLLGVYPRGEKPGDAKVDQYRANITAVNAAISKWDGKRGVKYLYFGDKFLTPDGTIPKSLMPDFLHLSTEGYQIWADSIRDPLQELLK
jgi:lysophospholipase L1-like esterase